MISEFKVVIRCNILRAGAVFFSLVVHRVSRPLVLVLLLVQGKREIGLFRGVFVFQYQKARFGLDSDRWEMTVRRTYVRESFDDGHNFVTFQIGAHVERILVLAFDDEMSESLEFGAARTQVFRLVVEPVVVELTEARHTRLRGQSVYVHRHIGLGWIFQLVEQRQSLPTGVIGVRHGRQKPGQ